MSAKPGTPITRKEMYLDVMTGGSSSLPEPITLEEMYLAKIAGMAVDLPTPRYIKHKYLAKIAGMTVNVPTYTTNLPRIYAYLAKAAGQDIEVPQPITREEMYWFDYVGGEPAPSEREYTGAVPVTFTANGQPLLDYLISGNMSQTGTPSPTTPIQPQECGERTGNLFDKTTLENGIYLVAKGNKYGDVTNGVRAGVKIKVLPNTAYTLSAQSSAIVSLRILEWSNGTFTTQTPKYNISGNISLTVTTDAETTEIAFNIEGANGQYVTNIMLNTGSTPLPYEPYGYKIPFSSANTTTPVYLGEVETTRKIKKLVLTGNEIILRDREREGSWRFFTDKLISAKGSTGICSHFENIGTNGVNDSDNIGFSIFNNAQFGCRCPKSIADTVTDFKSYLAQQYAAGTPVTVWYVLASETTAVVNEPLMKIGDYADTLSMEQAGAQIPTVNGENTLDVLTDLKPSEVYIKYKGEPVAGSQTSSQSSAYAPAEVSGQSENADDINSNLLGKKEETE